MIVLDATVVVELTLHLDRFEPVEARLENEASAHAPHLVDLEVASALRRLVRRGVVSETRATQALVGLGALRIVRYPHLRLLERIWELRHALSSYDAAYVALAEALDAPLLTTDKPLSRSAGHGARIELVAA